MAVFLVLIQGELTGPALQPYQTSYTFGNCRVNLVFRLIIGYKLKWDLWLSLLNERLCREFARWENWQLRFQILLCAKITRPSYKKVFWVWIVFLGLWQPEKTQICVFFSLNLSKIVFPYFTHSNVIKKYIKDLHSILKLFTSP